MSHFIQECILAKFFNVFIVGKGTYRQQNSRAIGAFKYPEIGYLRRMDGHAGIRIGYHFLQFQGKQTTLFRIIVFIGIMDLNP